ncbi:thymidine kinase [Entomoplasma freundtii]|uniref:Thymidine kinase n=1 Tax=Entomoplasma freundtii TaxID=74700 RepID=A0A2K8NQQ3_9MOLU|nr:thymidine kinase [Entomoplasma freundtii]ATZ16117.1 thymidine kinase [Entomoplasma freundtii]TDY56982.1 thymidine kinase [Entomoplasma freundtii]
MVQARQFTNKRTAKKIGWIELITGCMFAGKTEEFIRRLRRHSYAKNNVIAFKPAIDKRYSEKAVASHNGTTFTCYPVASVQEMQAIFEVENSKQLIDVVGIDEVQFLDETVVDFIEELANQGLIVITTGLDRDFKADPFQNVDRLLVLAEYVDKLTAICHQCGNLATRTQRLVKGKAASKNDPLILVDGSESYEARCRNCYQQAK